MNENNFNKPYDTSTTSTTSIIKQTMYNELVKRLRNDATAFVGFIEEDLRQAADAIEELSKQFDDWIPVTERLPEKNIEVLVFAEGKIEGFLGDTVIAISKRYDFKIFTDSKGVEVWQSPWQYFLTEARRANGETTLHRKAI